MKTDTVQVSRWPKMESELIRLIGPLKDSTGKCAHSREVQPSRAPDVSTKLCTSGAGQSWSGSLTILFVALPGIRKDD